MTYDLSQIDTDGDGLSDWDEISVYKTDPMRVDTDGDGYGTDPRRANTDGDGVKDGAEVKQGTDPKDPSSALPQNLPEIPRWQMRVVSVDNQELSAHDGRAQNVIDGNNKTIWHTEWSAKSPKDSIKI